MNNLCCDIEKYILTFIHPFNKPILRFVCRKWNYLLKLNNINITTIYHINKYNYKELKKWLKQKKLYSKLFKEYDIEPIIILNKIKKETINLNTNHNFYISHIGQAIKTNNMAIIKRYFFGYINKFIDIIIDYTTTELLDFISDKLSTNDKKELITKSIYKGNITILNYFKIDESISILDLFSIYCPCYISLVYLNDQYNLEIFKDYTIDEYIKFINQYYSRIPLKYFPINTEIDKKVFIHFSKKLNYKKRVTLFYEKLNLFSIDLLHSIFNEEELKQLYKSKTIIDRCAIVNRIDLLEYFKKKECLLKFDIVTPSKLKTLQYILKNDISFNKQKLLKEYENIIIYETKNEKIIWDCIKLYLWLENNM